MFIIFIIIGILSFLYILHIEIKKDADEEKEMLFIIPKILYSMLFAYLFAGIADSVFKLGENKKIILSGITFYGGLFGGIISIYIQLSFAKNTTKYTVKAWFDILTLPLISFHVWGRLGCFFAGCCYGKTTDSMLGIMFPDNKVANVFHNGNKCYPTQLFEMFALMIIFFIITRSKSKFKLYMVLYAVSRFFIEFFRGDNRGFEFMTLSPAQLISVIIVMVTMMDKLKNVMIVVRKKIK